LIAASAHAQQSPDWAIAPFVDDQTLVVVRIDAANVNPSAVVDWMAAQLAARKVEQPGIDLVRRNWQPRAERAGALLTGLRNANAQHLYWLLSVSDFSGARSVSDFWERSRDKGVWVAPLPAGSDAPAVLRMLSAEKSRDGKAIFESKQFGNVAVAAARGRLPQPGNQSLAGAWAQALAGNAPIRVAVFPGSTLRRAFEENMGGVGTPNAIPMTTFTRDLQWLSVSLAQPPGAKLSATIQATDPAAANRAHDAIRQALAGLHGLKIEMPWWSLPPLENIDTLVSFRVDGSQLKWTPDVTNSIEPLAAREIEASISLLASSNMKQILLGAIMHANNTRQFPPDLPTLMKAQDLSPGVLKDPLHPQEAVGYEYVKPADWQKDAEKTPVLYEKWSGGKLVGFADGHVEALESRAAVESLMRSHQPGK
jgi:hypothetical protein